MNKLIPITFYTLFYYIVILTFVLITYYQSNSTTVYNERNLNSKKVFGFIVFLFVLLYMGTRPISFEFGDMGVYAIDFQKYKNGHLVKEGKDVFFNRGMAFFSKLISAETFFFFCSLLYVLPLYQACKRIFSRYSFYAFMMLVTSMSFWAYGTNGIRNGLATSIFTYALSHRKELIRVPIMVLSTFFHLSMLLPLVAYFVAKFVKNVKFLFLGWLLAIFLSAAFGGFWEQLFLNLGLVEEDRLAGYLVGDASLVKEIKYVKVGFRWDFILYSGFGIFAGYYFLIKQKLQDEFYRVLYGTYIIANAFWILVIRANFSNRFAYLSWFLMGLVIIYPLLKYQYFKKQHAVLGSIIVIYFLFTFVLNIFLK